MRITNTNGNARNGIRGSRITVYTDDGMIVDRFTVPAMYCTALQYCQRHPKSKYTARLQLAIDAADGWYGGAEHAPW